VDKTRLIVVGRIIDGSGAAVRRGVFLTIKNGIITAIGSTKNLPENSNVAVDDFSHCTILPALVDCSVFLALSPSVDRSVRLFTEEANFATKRIILERHIHYCQTHGVLGVANSGDLVELQQYSQDGVKPKSIITIRTSGPLCRSKQDCAAANSTAVDFIKVPYSTNVGDDESPHPQLSHEELCHILQHKSEKKTIVVANGPQQVTEALNAGCDAIEQGYGMGEENLRKMAEKHVLWIPNVVRAKNGLDSASGGGDVSCRFSTRYVAPGKAIPGAEEFWKKALDEQLAQLRLAKELGVITAVGTGAGSVGILHGESMVEEMKLFIKAGYSLEEAISCASENGARFFDMENLGALTIGQKATFLISRGTAKQLPRKLSYLESIYVDGAPSTAYCKHPVIR
jgi:imidazolonepropionase-like amidohydrolase